MPYVLYRCCFRAVNFPRRLNSLFSICSLVGWILSSQTVGCLFSWNLATSRERERGHQRLAPSHMVNGWYLPVKNARFGEKNHLPGAFAIDSRKLNLGLDIGRGSLTDRVRGVVSIAFLIKTYIFVASWEVHECIQSCVHNTHVYYLCQISLFDQLLGGISNVWTFVVWFHQLNFAL